MDYKNDILLMPSESNRADFDDALFDFLEASQKIKTIIAHENAILEACGYLSLDAYLTHRSALLKSYEAKAETICQAIVAASPDDKVVHSLLIEEIASVRNTLSDNAVRQFQSLENELTKMSGDTPWH